MMPLAGFPPRPLPVAGVRRYLGLVEEVKRMFVVVGEALVDLVGQRGGRTLAAHPGGSPANVALGLARLGAPVTLMTRLGRDAFGAMVRSHLEDSGVRVDGGPEDGVSTSLAIAMLAAGIASYDFRIDWSRRAASTRVRWRRP
jgi:sugar/nucleoside kinase (ribokinase family)